MLVRVHTTLYHSKVQVHSPNKRRGMLQETPLYKNNLLYKNTIFPMSLRGPLRGERSSQTGSQSDDAKIHTKHTPTTKFTSHPLQSLPFSITQIKHYIQMLMVMLFLSNPPFLQNTPSYICPSGGRYARGGPPRRGPVLRRHINTLLRYTFTSYKVMVTLFPTLSQGYGHTFYTTITRLWSHFSRPNTQLLQRSYGNAPRECKHSSFPVRFLLRNWRLAQEFQPIGSNRKVMVMPRQSGYGYACPSAGYGNTLLTQTTGALSKGYGNAQREWKQDGWWV